MRIQRSADHRVVPWANGLGVTADVFVWPAGADDWTWRLSIADISDDLPFSFMPGIDRHIVVAQGQGMVLTVDGALEQRMDRGTPPLFFAGESATRCRLLDGPIAALNLMLRRGRAMGGLRVVAVPPAVAIKPSPGDVAIVVLDGSLNVGATPLTTFDAVLLQQESPPRTGPAEYPGRVDLPIAGAAGARVAVAAVHDRQPLCGTALRAITRLRDPDASPPA